MYELNIIINSHTRQRIIVTL